MDDGCGIAVAGRPAHQAAKAGLEIAIQSIGMREP